MKPFAGGKAMKTVAPKKEIKTKVEERRGLKSQSQPVGSASIIRPTRSGGY